MVTTTEYAQLSAAVYEAGGAGTTDPNWIRTNYRSLENGFYAATFEKSTVDPVTGEISVEIVIAFRGTDGPFDAVADYQLTVDGQAPQQLVDAAQYYSDMNVLYEAQYPNSPITVTGHSLGGAMASYVAAKSPDQPTATE